MTTECKNCYESLTEYIKAHYNPEHPQSTLITILHFAQDRFGYLSPDTIEHIAQETEIPAAEIYGVVTFYSYFKTKPQGKHTISVCMGTACYIRGAAKLLEEIEDRLDIKVGETTKDNMFTLTQTRCIGACGLAPVLTIDEDVHAQVEPEQIKTLLAEYME